MDYDSMTICQWLYSEMMDTVASLFPWPALRRWTVFNDRLLGFDLNRCFGAGLRMVHMFSHFRMIKNMFRKIAHWAEHLRK